jgi:hypothetical protein
MRGKFKMARRELIEHCLKQPPINLKLYEDECFALVSILSERRDRNFEGALIPVNYSELADKIGEQLLKELNNRL